MTQAKASMIYRSPAAVAPWHVLHDAHSFRELDVLTSTPARSSVMIAANNAPWNPLATEPDKS